MILQLNPALPLDTPRGPALAHVMIDYGIEMDLMWVCFCEIDGQCWTFRNQDVRATRNITIGRDFGREPEAA